MIPYQILVSAINLAACGLVLFSKDDTPNVWAAFWINLVLGCVFLLWGVSICVGMPA